MTTMEAENEAPTRLTTTPTTTSTGTDTGSLQNGADDDDNRNKTAATRTSRTKPIQGGKARDDDDVASFDDHSHFTYHLPNNVVASFIFIIDRTAVSFHRIIVVVVSSRICLYDE